MNLTQFKRRLLDSFLVTINITKMEVNVEYEERVCRKNFYTFIGINIYEKCLKTNRENIVENHNILNKNIIFGKLNLMYQTAENASLQSIEPIILIKLTNNNYEFLNGKTKITIDNEGNIININTNAKYYPYVKSGKISYIISFDEIMQQLKKDTNATTLKKIFNTETTDIKKIKQYDEEFIDIYLNYINTNSEVLENKPVKFELKKNNEEI